MGLLAGGPTDCTGSIGGFGERPAAFLDPLDKVQGDPPATVQWQLPRSFAWRYNVADLGC